MRTSYNEGDTGEGLFMDLFGGDFDGFDGGDDEVIEFTAGKGFNIRTHAREFSDMMMETGLDLILHLRNVSVEFEAGCTPKEIIDGYFYALQQRRPATGAASNCNLPAEPLPV